MKTKDVGVVKIRVVWLCHFANTEMKEYFKMTNFNNSAPWIDLLIQLFKKVDTIDLHIVAPNVFTNRDCNFTKDNINYHFYKFVPIPNNNKIVKRLVSIFKFDILTNYSWIKFKTSKIIKNINPDIIQLHGAENAQSYSAGILPLLNLYPVVTTIQGFVSQSTLTDRNTVQRIKIEKEIISKCLHFGIRTEDMKSVILNINPKAIFHFHNYPIEIPKIVKDNIGNEEPIDCLFFARVCKDKGIEDLLKAISLVKEQLPNVSLSVIGGTGAYYLDYLKKMCLNLNITDNVSFLGFFPTQEEIFEYALKAKVCVLPTYHDIIPGTIIESMFMKLPVIAYKVGGIPELNNKLETVKLVEKFNVIQLAKKISELIGNVELRKQLAENAYENIKQNYNNEAIPDKLESIYGEIITQ